MNEEQIIDKVSMIDQWKVSGDSYTQGELDAIGQLLELYYDNKKQLEQEKEKNKDLEEKLKIAVAILTKGTYPEENEGDNDFDKQFIAVDKIKGIQGRLFVQLGSYVRNEASPEQERIAGGINIINEMLEEK